MVHVLHVITSLDTGGAQSMLARLLSSKETRGVRGSVVSLMPGGGCRPRIEATGTVVHDLGMTKAWPDPRVLRRLAKLMGDERPDVVQTWLYHGDLVGTLAARWAGVGPVAWNLRCSFGHAKRRLSSRAAPYACAKLSRMPAVIVSNSRAGRETHAAIGYRPRRWELIPNGFDMDQLCPEPGAREALLKELNLPDDALLIGMVARLHPVKDHPKVLRAVHALASEFPSLVLILVGEGLGANDEGLRALRAEAPGLDADRIVGLGARSDVAHLMSAFDVLLSASTHEGFPNVLGEALACGTPCVATEAGDSRELVGTAGRIVPVHDEQAFVKALGEVLSLSAAERQELGARGRDHVREHYAIESVVRRYVALWEELAQPCAV